MGCKVQGQSHEKEKTNIQKELYRVSASRSALVTTGGAAKMVAKNRVGKEAIRPD